MLFYDNYRYYDGQSEKYRKIHTMNGEKIRIQILPESQYDDSVEERPETIMEQASTITLAQRVKSMPDLISDPQEVCAVIIRRVKLGNWSGIMDTIVRDLSGITRLSLLITRNLMKT